jgi:hypothetical protein
VDVIVRRWERIQDWTGRQQATREADGVALDQAPVGQRLLDDLAVNHKPVR